MRVELDTAYYEETDDIAHIVINMPPANKMIPKFLEDIVSLIMDYGIHTKMKGIIVSGAGRHFSSGADVELLIKTVCEKCIYENRQEMLPPERNINVKKAFCTLYECRIPVVSVISGFCIGSGYELALQTHIRIAEKGSRVGLPETTFGLIPGINGTIRCIEKLGYKKAMEFILRGDLVAGDEALNMNLVDCMTDKKQGMSMAIGFIQYATDQKIPYSNKSAKEILNNYLMINRSERRLE